MIINIRITEAAIDYLEKELADMWDREQLTEIVQMFINLCEKSAVLAPGEEMIVPREDLSSIVWDTRQALLKRGVYLNAFSTMDEAIEALVEKTKAERGRLSRDPSILIEALRKIGTGKNYPIPSESAVNMGAIARSALHRWEESEGERGEDRLRESARFLLSEVSKYKEEAFPPNILEALRDLDKVVFPGEEGERKS